jgi:uncharacterized protein YkwD
LTVRARGALVSIVALALVAACGGSRGGPGAGAPARGADDGQAETRTIVERMPDGSVKKTTITTTKKTVPAPPPPPRPADPWPGDPRVRYNVERINAYRSQHGLGALLYDAKISAFARAGSERLAKDHTPHANFAEHGQGAPGFGSVSAENQGDPDGVPSLDADEAKSHKKQIDVMLKLMVDEGPGGGHYENMMNPRFRRVGVGLVETGGRLYMTNDFSD